MNKREIFSHYSKIIDNLIESSPFFAAYFQSPFYLESNLYGDCDSGLPYNISICDGATRSCIIDDEYDYVVKFDIDEDRYGSVCERETEIYRAAKAVSLECYFNEITFIGEYTRTFYFYDFSDIQQHCNYLIYNFDSFDKELQAHEEEMSMHSITVSIPLYTCRRATEYDCGPYDKNLVMQAKKIKSPLCGRNLCVATAFIKNYGIQAYELISQFALEHGINDLHVGNVGEVEGEFTLIDFGGYHSIDDDYDEEEEDSTEL